MKVAAGRMSHIELPNPTGDKDPHGSNHRSAAAATLRSFGVRWMRIVR